MKITQIWKEFIEDQDKIKTEAEKEYIEEISKISKMLKLEEKKYKKKVQNSSWWVKYGFGYMESFKPNYNFFSQIEIMEELREKYQIKERTLENALTWYNKTHENK